MDRKIGVLFFVLLLVFSLGVVLADEHDPLEEDAEKIQEAIDKIPIDESGEFVNPIDKTKAEERVEKINTFVGPITLFLFAAELSLSWIFIFSLFMFLILIEIVYAPVTEIFKFNPILSFFIAIIISIISMRGFGDNFVAWMNSLATTWFLGIFVVVAMFIFSGVYRFGVKHFAKGNEEAKEKEEKLQTSYDRSIIHIEAEAAKKTFGG